MQCPTCKTTLPDGARFCSVCGAQVAQQLTCAQCGQPVRPGQKFCMICGAALAPISAEPPPRTEEIPEGDTTPSPQRRRQRWLWLIPLLLLIALVVAAVALDVPAKVAQRLGREGRPTPQAAEVSQVNPEALWEQAQAQATTGHWEEALALITRLRTVQGGADYRPAEVSALAATACANLAAQAEANADPAAASAYWACVLAERPGDADALAGQRRADLYQRGVAASEAGQFPQAIAAWEELHRSAAGYADVAERLYQAYIAYGEALCARRTPADVEEGRKQYGLARGLDPARPEAGQGLRACQVPTFTPSPTPIPTATPTPLPGPLLGVILEDVTTLRVRSGPGAGYFVLGKLTAGDAVTITGRTADATWLEIAAAPDRQGWVNGEYVRTNYPVDAAPVLEVPPLPKRLVVAQASADFSSQQGFRDWFYLTSVAPGSLQFTRMPFDSDGTYRWCCHATYSSAMRVWRSGAYPSVRNDAVRLWVSPYEGQLRIAGVARKEPYFGAGGNGVLVRIVQNETVLWEYTLGPSESSATAFDLNAISKPGDSFYFVVSARGDDYGDSVLFDPTIELLHPEGVDAPAPARWAEAVPTAPAAVAAPAPATLCFEPRLRHYEEHKGCCAEVAGMVYNRQGQPFGPRGAVVHIEGPPAPNRYVHEFGVDAGGGYTVTALSVDKYTIWLAGPNIRSKKHPVEYPDLAKIRMILDFYQVACW